ncbi:unnamed protein product [Chrysoparadoxa australica]
MSSPFGGASSGAAGGFTFAPATSFGGSAGFGSFGGFGAPPPSAPTKPQEDQGFRAWGWRSATEVEIMGATDREGDLVGFSGPEVKALMEGSQAVFRRVQELQGSGHGMRWEAKHELLKCSREYRALFARCITALDVGDDEEDSDEQELLASMKYFARIWHVAEVCMIDPGPVLTREMVQCLRETYQVAQEELEIKELEARLPTERRAELSEWYWALLQALLLRGETTRAAAALRLHSEYIHDDPSNAVGVVVGLMASMPRHAADPALVRQFQAEWSRWNAQCIASQRYLGGEVQLQLLCRMMAGDLEALEQAAQRWDHLLAGELLYRLPMARRQEMLERVQVCRTRLPPNEGAGTQMLSAVLLKVMDLDIGSLLAVVLTLGASLPLAAGVAHLVDLLVANGSLQQDMLPDPGPMGTPVREALLLDLSEKLFSLPAGWDLAAVYLAACPTLGEGTLKALIGRSLPDNDRGCSQLVTWCRRAGLNEEANAVCRVRGVHWLKQQRLGAAASWFIEGQDGPRLGRMCGDLADEMVAAVSEGMEQSAAAAKPCSTGVELAGGRREVLVHFMELAVVVLKAIPNSDAVPYGPEVLFLERYRALVGVLLEGGPNVRQRAALNIVAMLQGDMAPARAWPHLLQLALPLLEPQPEDTLPPFSTAQTQALMAKLQALETSHRYRDFGHLLEVGILCASS